uniref:Mothers against decapentaplegic 2 n=1 Tax=Aceria tosichella TaxID=561515 RepID=A0A6G1S6A7_9ACAR
MSDNRFCVKALPNSKRDSYTEWIRRRIGRGAKIIYDNGDVYIECLSEACIYVNDPLEAYTDEGVPRERVMKLSPGPPVRVFSASQFSKLLNEAYALGYEAVFDLTNRCAIRASIAKGWGQNYRLESVSQTPCWFEILMIGPLQWIDRALRQLEPPSSTNCASNT